VIYTSPKIFGERNIRAAVRWELQAALDLDLPIIAINLNGALSIDVERCPAIIRDEYVVYVSLKMKITKLALDNFTAFYESREPDVSGHLYYLR
jgi:hypothetical protein